MWKGCPITPLQLDHPEIAALFDLPFAWELIPKAFEKNPCPAA